MGLRRDEVDATRRRLPVDPVAQRRHLLAVADGVSRSADQQEFHVQARPLVAQRGQGLDRQLDALDGVQAADVGEQVPSRQVRAEAISGALGVTWPEQLRIDAARNHSDLPRRRAVVAHEIGGLALASGDQQVGPVDDPSFALRPGGRSGQRQVHERPVPRQRQRVRPELHGDPPPGAQPQPGQPRQPPVRAQQLIGAEILTDLGQVPGERLYQWDELRPAQWRQRPRLHADQSHAWPEVTQHGLIGAGRARVDVAGHAHGGQCRRH
jgi:hypothetical protein